MEAVKAVGVVVEAVEAAVEATVEAAVEEVAGRGRAVRGAVYGAVAGRGDVWVCWGLVHEVQHVQVGGVRRRHEAPCGEAWHEADEGYKVM